MVRFMKLQQAMSRTSRATPARMYEKEVRLLASSRPEDRSLRR